MVISTQRVARSLEWSNQRNGSHAAFRARGERAGAGAALWTPRSERLKGASLAEEEEERRLRSQPASSSTAPRCCGGTPGRAASSCQRWQGRPSQWGGRRGAGSEAVRREARGAGRGAWGAEQFLTATFLLLTACAPKRNEVPNETVSTS